MEKYETMYTGRGSKAHFDHLKGAIKGELSKIRIVECLEKMNFDEIEARANELCDEYDKSPTDEIEFEMRIIRDVMLNIIEGNR